MPAMTATLTPVCHRDFSFELADTDPLAVALPTTEPDFFAVPHVKTFSKSGSYEYGSVVTSSTAGAKMSLCGTTERTGAFSFLLTRTSDMPSFKLGQKYHVRAYPDKVNLPNTFIASTILITSDSYEVDTDSADGEYFAFDIFFESDYNENGRFPGA